MLLHSIQIQKTIFLTSQLTYTLAVFLESVAITHGKYQTSNCATEAVESQHIIF